MRVVLADLKGRNGHVTKDTIAGGYGSRFRGLSTTTKILEVMRRIYQNLPSIHTAYLAAIFSSAGHEVVITRHRMIEGDLALVLSSMVDHRHEIGWAEQFRKQTGNPAGFFGTFATYHSPYLMNHADFVIQGEPESAGRRLAAGEVLKGIVPSPAIPNLDDLPFPRWDLATKKRFNYSAGRSLLPSVCVFPVLSSRSCPEFCTYCPHRIVGPYRARTAESVIDEIQYLSEKFGKLNLVFRDPLFTEDRERSTAIAEGLIRKELPVHFECETRLDDLDTELIDLLHRAGLRSITFGVESMDPAILKKVGRRPIPPDHQKKIIAYCHNKRIRTGAFYVFGFLQDTLESIRGTIDYAIELNTTTAGFKILTPYPGTPLRKQMERLVSETDLEKFDGYTPTFNHPNLTKEQLSFLLTSAYARYYVRPSWPLHYFRMQEYFSRWLGRWDAYARRRHNEIETELGFPYFQDTIGTAS